MTTRLEPQLIRSDAWVLAATLQGRGHWRRIDRLLNDADYLNTSLLTYHEISYGLPRLVACGYVETRLDPNGRLVIGPTDRAKDVSSRAHKTTGSRVALSARFDEELGCAPYPMDEVEDRSLGQLTNLTERDWQSAVESYRRDSEGWIRRAGQVGGLMRRFLRWRRPKDYPDDGTP